MKEIIFLNKNIHNLLLKMGRLFFFLLCALVMANTASAQVLFYNNSGAATKTNNQTFAAISTHSFSPDWTQAVMIGNDRMLFYNAASRQALVTNTRDFATISNHTFSDWTHIVYLGSNRVLFYNAGSGLAVTTNNQDFTTLTQHTFSPWTHIVKIGPNRLLFYNASSGVAVLTNDRDFATISTHAFSAWTHIVGIGDRVLFYNTNSGLATITDNQNFSTIGTHSMAGGWTHILSIDSDRILFYNARSGAATVTDNQRFGTIGTHTMASGWSLIVNTLITDLNDAALRGFVDMHTHPMSHLSMGGKIVYGAPDGNMAASLNNCNASHGGFGFFDNPGGDYIRAEVVNMLDEHYVHRARNGVGDLGHTDHPHAGYPGFQHWPHWSSATHQQMWWEWIKRAHEGGLNVMVALAVHNGLINKAAAGNGDRVWDDKASVALQLTEMRRFVSNHSDFMEIAKTPADLRRIVAQGKLAIILGVETEDLGNLARRKYFENENITPEKIRAEIQNLYDQFDVRYILPLHFSNNIFGGTALTRNLFLLSSKYYTNSYPTPRESCGEGIGYTLGREAFGFPKADALRSRDLGWVLDGQPAYPTPSAGCGQRNVLGLSMDGRTAIEEMMRLGIMIDVDHMSQQAISDLTAYASGARSYPLNSGHNGLRGLDAAPGPDANEHGKTEAQYRAILASGGMIGLGHGGSATGFVNAFRNVSRIAQNKNVAIGTDANGFYALAAPDPAARVAYGTNFRQYESPTGRFWNINTDGFAHYGLFPDFMKGWEAAGMTTAELNAFHSTAENFATMWETCARRSREIFSGAPVTRSISPDPVTNLCPSNRVAGDGDFGGHGPRVTGDVTLRISSDGNRLEAVINLSARETQSDWSEVRGTWTRTLYAAPAGMRITAISSAARATIDQVLSGGGRFEPTQGCDGDEHTLTPGGPVARIVMVGDTGGGDISTDADCNCDTRINRIEFNPVTVTLAPR